VENEYFFLYFFLAITVSTIHLIVCIVDILGTFQTITSRLITGDPNAFQIDETKVLCKISEEK
jgi:hypothetical protein